MYLRMSIKLTISTPIIIKYVSESSAGRAFAIYKISGGHKSSPVGTTISVLIN